MAAIIMVVVGFLVVPLIVRLLLSMVPQVVLGMGVDEADAWLKTPMATFLYVLFSQVITISILTSFIRRRKESFWSVAALGRPGWRDAGYALSGMLMYLVVFISTLVAVQLIVPIDQNQEQALGFDQSVSGAGLLLAFISLVILPPIAEEILFRGFVYGTLRSHGASFLAASLSVSVVFGFLHLFGGTGSELLWIAMLDTFILSLVLCYVREKTGNLWASIVVHALKNGLVFLNLFILSSR